MAIGFVVFYCWLFSLCLPLIVPVVVSLMSLCVVALCVMCVSV